MAVHFKRKLYECDICYKTDFLLFDHFASHMKSIHKVTKIEGFPYCEICSKNFKSQSIKSEHMKVKHGAKVNLKGHFFSGDSCSPKLTEQKNLP